MPTEIQEQYTKRTLRLNRYIVLLLILLLMAQFAEISVFIVSVNDPSYIVYSEKEDPSIPVAAVWAVRETLVLTAGGVRGVATWFVREALPAITWPIVVLLTIVVVIRSKFLRGQMASFFRRFERLKLGSTEVTFSEKGARNLKIAADETFSEFCCQADERFDNSSKVRNVREQFEEVVRKLELHNGTDDAKLCLDISSFRCALHVQDLLFEDSLYQVTNYYPKTGGNGAGRRFSVRYGIIGRAWRLGEHDAEGEAKAKTREDLVRFWGMTQSEADVMSRHRESYVCVMLKNAGGIPLGILYMDAEESNAFGDRTEALAFAADAAKVCHNLGFTESLQGLVDVLQRYKVSIKIHGS